MKKLALAVAVVALTAATALAADVAGTWSVEGEVYGNPVKFTTVWKQDGETLSGTAALASGEVPITGTVKEQAVTFEFDVEHEGMTHHMVFTGTLGDDAGLKGTIAVSGVEGTFTAHRPGPTH